MVQWFRKDEVDQRSWKSAKSAHVRQGEEIMYELENSGPSDRQEHPIFCADC